MKIYTKTGDSGETSLLGGTRVLKNHRRIEAYGTVDELNSYIGLLRDQEVNKKRSDFLANIQDRLFTIGSMLASDPDKPITSIPKILPQDAVLLEEAIDALNGNLPELRSFILPGGHPSVSFGHIARCVCRRAERNVVALQEKETEEIVRYLNRLSDYLFVLCRAMTSELGAEELLWKPKK